MRAKNSRDALRSAAALIRQKGHTKHHFEDADGLCALGALNLATKGNSDGLGNRVAQAAARRLARHLKLATPFDLIAWNNAAERTGTEVISAMRAAARS